MDFNTLSAQKAVFDFVEHHLKINGCRIQTFIAGKQTQYVIKKGSYNISESFDNLYDTVMWVQHNLNKLSENK